MPDDDATATGAAVIASGHQEVSRAALAILDGGGNAFDAAVAGGFVSAIAEPALTSLGGGGFLLAAERDGTSTLYDFFVDTPGRGLNPESLDAHFHPVTIDFKGATQTFNIGAGSVGVPGMLRGLVDVQGHRGRLPLGDVLAPAIALAKDGVVLTELQASTLSLLYPILGSTPEGAAMFGRDGAPLQRGDRFCVPELADFLSTLPHGGVEAFYRGSIARDIAAYMAENGGLLTREDLANYELIERAPLSVSYRGRTLLTNPMPSLGGSLIALSLHLLEKIPLDGLPFLGVAHITTLAAVLDATEQLRARGITHPDQLSEHEWQAAAERVRVHSRGTTHLTVCDREGTIVSMTTSNGEGSGHFAPGTGIMLNNMLGEDDLHPDGFHSSPPGIRVSSMMAPSILVDSAGRPLFGLGSGGSKRIRTAIFSVVSHVVDFDRTLREAVDAERVHYEDGTIQLEGGFHDDVKDALRQHWTINAWPGKALYFGGVHAAGPFGVAADARRGGAIAKSPS